MRPIKFRAWDKDKGEMLSDEWIQTLDMKGNGDWVVYIGGGLKQVMRGDSYARENFVRENIILLQYTGLKDKNGVEIYEGDILRMSPQCKYVVIFRDGSFAEIHYPDDGWIHYFKDMADNKGQILDEVIGNIYENKELLK